ncbi:MAG: NfeD family protein [Clostridiales bacterium]|nr:NfeD family protein [Clostridiales bacterium]
MYIWLWIIIIAISLIVEFFTAGLVSIWFVAGALVSLLLSLFEVHLIIQIVVFIVVSLLCLIFFKKIFGKRFTKSVKTNADAIIGKDFKLVLPISFNTPGSVKANGVEWSAVSENEQENLESGTLVKVIDIQGNKLIVKKINKNIEEEK